MLTGMTLVRNGNKFQYPWKECITNLSLLCDKVIVNYGITCDGTLDDLLALRDRLGNVAVYSWDWDMSNTGDGRELAIQANNLLKYISTPWVLYLQADEFVHPDIKERLYKTLSSLPSKVNQIELYRTYFWETISQRLPRDEIYLGRIFRNGTHIIGGDGMYLVQKVSGDIIRLDDLIFHYSRVGPAEVVNKRYRNIDTLFHPVEEVHKFQPFKYDLLASELVEYTGKHPYGIQEFYRCMN